MSLFEMLLLFCLTACILSFVLGFLLICVVLLHFFIFFIFLAIDLVLLLHHEEASMRVFGPSAALKEGINKFFCVDDLLLLARTSS